LLYTLKSSCYKSGRARCISLSSRSNNSKHEFNLKSNTKRRPPTYCNYQYSLLFSTNFIFPIFQVEQQQSSTAAQPIYTAFLNSQGRVVFDAFIFPLVQEQKITAYLLDVDSDFGAEVTSRETKKKFTLLFF
jgi:hypothetical protein